MSEDRICEQYPFCDHDSCHDLVNQFVVQIEELKRLKGCCKWEADHQREALKEYGLDEEFGQFDCDAIEHVAEALVLARKELEGYQSLSDLLDLYSRRMETLLEREHLWDERCEKPHPVWEKVRILKEVLAEPTP